MIYGGEYNSRRLRLINKVLLAVLIQNLCIGVRGVTVNWPDRSYAALKAVSGPMVQCHANDVKRHKCGTNFHFR